jgi:hypothetical protein
MSIGKHAATSDRAVWYFGDYPEDGEAWLTMPELMTVYVDFRVGGAPLGPWRRVTVVTHAWIRRQLAEGTAGPASWPPLLVMPNGSPDQIRAWISDIVESGGPVLEANSDALPDGWHPATGPRPTDEY